MNLSVFSIIKNESQFIGYGVMSLLPYVDEIVYADGNSTDGTLELLDYIKSKYDPEGKIKVFKGMDCADFKEDYVRLFNELMEKCDGRYLWYSHPDMILTEPGKLADRGKWDFKAAYVNMRSFAGEDMDMEIVKGRTDKWKTIMKNDFGLHYWGYYGDPHEDMYFKHITGSEHKVNKDMRRYPFAVEDSGIKVWHMCECKPRKRREQKMETVLKTIYNVPDGKSMFDTVMNHPRVHLQDQNSYLGEFKFEPRKDDLPEVFHRYKDEFNEILGRKLICA